MDIEELGHTYALRFISGRTFMSVCQTTSEEKAIAWAKDMQRYHPTTFPSGTQLVRGRRFNTYYVTFGKQKHLDISGPRNVGDRIGGINHYLFFYKGCVRRSISIRHLPRFDFILRIWKDTIGFGMWIDLGVGNETETVICEL